MWLAKLLKDYVVGTLKKVANTERGEDKKKKICSRMHFDCTMGKSIGAVSESQIGERQMNIWMNGL